MSSEHEASSERPSVFVNALRKRLEADLDSSRWKVRGDQRCLEAIRQSVSELLDNNGFRAQLWVVPQHTGHIRCAFELAGNKALSVQRDQIAHSIREFSKASNLFARARPSKGSTIARLELDVNDLHADVARVQAAVGQVVDFCFTLEGILIDWSARTSLVVDANSQVVDSAALPSRQADPLLRCRIEQAAINKTISEFEADGYLVYSQEKDNVGWDLVATCGKRQLHLEVKGLSGSVLCVELTPNEYAQMQARRDSYYVCIVTDALTNPQLAKFRYNPESGTWQDDQERTLQIESVVAARCRATLIG